MPVPKKKSTTSTTDPSISEQASSALPEQLTFHEHLRALTRSAVRVVIEEVMREELKQFLGAAWGEYTPKRKGYRNGTYTRDLATSSGPLENLHVPRDREGNFHTEVFDRYSRFEPEVAEGLTQMFGHHAESCVKMNGKQAGKDLTPTASCSHALLRQRKTVSISKIIGSQAL
jgi:putative transposase